MVVLGMQSLNWYGHGGFMEKKRHLMGIVRATERDDSSSSSSSSSQRFKIDRDKAREALKQLDQQIESQADEKTRILVKTSSDSGGSSIDPFMFEEPPEISGSFLTTSAFLLLGFTLFYNILFFTVIKPSMDGPESVPEEKSVPMSDSEIVQFPLLSSKSFKQ